MSRQLQAGSRVVLVLTVIKEPARQINYGTGKDVSDARIQDAGTPLEIKWFTDSYVDLPVWRYAAAPGVFIGVSFRCRCGPMLVEMFWELVPPLTRSNSQRDDACALKNHALLQPRPKYAPEVKRDCIP